MRGPKKHLKVLAAPRTWYLSKLGGVYAPRPRPGPHRLRESLPLLLILRNRLKFALNATEATFILKQSLVRVDMKVRQDPKFGVGIMDVIEIAKVGKKYRVLNDVKGRQVLVPIAADEARRKLLKVKKLMYGPNRVPFAVCHDGRVVRYPDPMPKKNDTLVFNLESKQVEDWVRFKPGTLATVTSGANTGRVGVIVDKERHPGSFDIVHMKDAAGHEFATRIGFVFVIGKSAEAGPLVTLPKAKGVRLGLVQDRNARIAKRK